MIFEKEEADCTLECLKSHVHSLLVTESGQHVCTGGRELVKIIDASTGDCSTTLEGHTHDVNALAVVGDTLFTGADAKGAQREYLKSWDITTGTLINSFAGHSGGVWALATAPGMLFSGSEDGT